MAGATGRSKEGAVERRIWELLTRDFSWAVPPDNPVQVFSPAGDFTGSARLQVFEMAVTMVLAAMRPDFAWCVTQNLHDDGVDFIGVQEFLENAEMGIAATITVGGQCKKRTTVKDLLGEVAGSLISMADSVNPTFFVVALSARITRARVERAREALERRLQRHCHILDRAQIEGLFAEHLDVVVPVLREGLNSREADEVLHYFRERDGRGTPPSVVVGRPTRVLGGVPFRIGVEVSWPLASNPRARMRWEAGDEEAAGIVGLIGPVGADHPSGVSLSSTGSGDDPLRASVVLELMTHAIGEVDLGRVVVGLTDGTDWSGISAPLGSVFVVETMRPRFFELPYRGGMAQLDAAYEKSSTGTVTTIGVVGAAGSGKSRLCEEFGLARRREGTEVVDAEQSKTHDAPHRLLAELFRILAEVSAAGDPAEHVLQSIATFDPRLADRIGPAIRSVFGSVGPGGAVTPDRSLVAALVLLIVARSRRAPLIVHLKDLHWCTADVLELIAQLVADLAQIARGRIGGDATLVRVLFIFEGRVRESGDIAGHGWTSAPFEAFLARLDQAIVVCSSLDSDDGLTFTRRLFEERHNQPRLGHDGLLRLQAELVERIHAAAGGNPFHTLEQVRLMKERGVIGQNPKTGLLFLVRPVPSRSILPASVFEAVEQRWHYVRDRQPELALLLWSCALLEDKLPAALFERLRRCLAPEVSLADIDGTDMLWTGDGRSHQVSFLHENYFESLRRFTVSYADREKAAAVYCAHYAEQHRLSPADQFRWAQALLLTRAQDATQANALIDKALRGARRAGDHRLARRVAAVRLDLSWAADERSPIRVTTFCRRCDDEIDLCRELLGTDRDAAARRLARVQERIRERLGAHRLADPVAAQEVEHRLFATEAIRAQVLFNDRRPAMSAELAEQVIVGIRARPRPPASPWEDLEMEALYTLSCAQAIAGDFPAAVRSSAAASSIAWESGSPLARKVISTYGTILLSQDIDTGESTLRSCLARWPDDDTSDAFLVHVHLSVALVYLARRAGKESVARRSLAEARQRSTEVHLDCRRLGLYADAAAAALVRGAVAAIDGEGDEAAWFAEGVASASRGRQMETLWKSHLNLSSALYQQAGRSTPTSRDHAVAAVEIMEDSLSVSGQPDRTPRFGILRVGLAQAASMLIEAGDHAGIRLLRDYPLLVSDFSAPATGQRHPPDAANRHYQWIRIGGADYAIY